MSRLFRSAAAAIATAVLLVTPLLLDPAVLLGLPGGGAGVDGTLEVKAAGLQLAACLILALSSIGVVLSARVSGGVGRIEAMIFGYVALAAASIAWAGQRGAASAAVATLAAAAVIAVTLGRLARSVEGARSVATWGALGAVGAGGVDALARRFGIGDAPVIDGAEKFHTLWFPHANVAALLLAPVAAGALGYAWAATEPRRRIGAAITGVAAMLLVLDLGSRAALAALGAGPLSFFMVTWLGRRMIGPGAMTARRRFAVAAAVLVAAAAAVLLPRHPAVSAVLKEGFNRAVAATGANYNASYMRPGLWKSTFAVAEGHEALGVGVGNLYYELPRVDPIEPYRPHAHSQYLQTFAELGGVGLLLLLAILVGGLAGLLHAAASADRERRALALAFGGASACLALHGALETPLEFPFTAVLLFGLAAMSVGLGVGGSEPRARVAGGAVRVGALLLALAALGLGIPTALAPLLQLERLRGGEQARVAGELDRAVSLYERAVSVGRDHFALHVPWAAAEMQRGRFAAAGAAWARAVARFPNAWRLHEQRAICLAREGDLDGALASLDRAAALRPAAGDLLYWRGRFQLDAGRLDEAIDALHQHGAANPDHAASRLALADALYSRAVRDDSLDDAVAARDAYRRYVAEGGVQADSWVSRRAAQLWHWIRLEEIGAEGEPESTEVAPNEKVHDGSPEQDDA